MQYTILPLTQDERQCFTLTVSLNGVSFYARVEVRYLPAPDCWVLSIWDQSTGDLLVNMIPLICSYEQINDLLRPFSYLRASQGLGSLFVLRNVDHPSTPDPAGGNLSEFQVLWGDWYE
jgi:hypothetical protein